MAGEDRRISTSDPAMSMARLQNALAQLSSGMRRRFSKGMPSSSSNWGLEGMYLA